MRRKGIEIYQRRNSTSTVYATIRISGQTFFKNYPVGDGKIQEMAGDIIGIWGSVPKMSDIEYPRRKTWYASEEIKSSINAAIEEKRSLVKSG
jgi:hypothetical protein